MSKYFTAAELQCQCPRKENGIDPNFVKRLDELREKFGLPLVISSGYRCPEHNAAVGGVPKSQHMQGIAADIYTAKMNSVDKYRLLQCVLSLGFTVGVKFDLLHVDTRPGLPLYFTYDVKK
jgi:uncharacterized protein YcbK (DUF882 family)